MNYIVFSSKTKRYVVLGPFEILENAEKALSTARPPSGFRAYIAREV